MFFYDPTFLLLIPAVILALYAQHKVKSSFEKYSKVVPQSGVSGAQVAKDILDKNGLSNVTVEHVQGELSDHYDPKAKVLRLSDSVYSSRSVSAVGVAAHEVGHALQHATNYAPLGLRSGLLGAASFGSTLAFPLFIVGLILSFPLLMDIGIIAFSIAVVFQVITLPVEFNASNRAMVLLKNGNYLTQEELPMAKSVLSAAALTYVASTAMAVLNLARLLILRGSRSD